MLTFGRHSFSDDELLVMAIINRTPDSFYDRGATYAHDAALDRVDQVVAQGAQIVDVGGVKAGPGEAVDSEEEKRRVVSFVAEVASRYPDVVISVDTWRSDVGAAVCAEGASLLNDAWGGHDRQLAAVAARFGVGLVCTHAGGLAPRTRPHRVQYPDVVAAVQADVVAQAERAVDLGVSPTSILIDPGHDFGKNTRHSLECTRRLPEMVASRWPVLVSLSNKDFIGESLDRPVGERLAGTLATTAISAWLGARAYRVHEVLETFDVLRMVQAIAGTRQPAVNRRGLA
ncbi:MAG: dihydropteroate synthase [Candidatus Nanopelagicales bacterium]